MTTKLCKIKDEEYFAIRDRFHASDAGKLLASPAYYKHCADNPKPPSDDMIKGKIIHAMMGDPDELRLYPTEVPGLAGLCNEKGKPYANPAASDAGKEIVAAWQKANPDAVLTKKETLADCRKMADALARREAAIGGTVIARETAILWTDSEGVGCVLKFDVLLDCGDFLVVGDYKKIGKMLTNKNLSQHVLDYGYHRSAAHYLDGVAAAQKAGLLPQKPAEFRLLWVSDVEPHESHVQVVPDTVLQQGAVELQVAKRRWSEGRTFDQWPEAGDLGLLDVQASLPRWAAKAGE